MDVPSAVLPFRFHLFLHRFAWLHCPCEMENSRVLFRAQAIFDGVKKRKAG
jgi:hypothetical protein